MTRGLNRSCGAARRARLAASLLAAAACGCTSFRPAQEFDPLARFVDKGMCPGESCVYTGKWRVNEDTRLYARPDTTSRVLDSAHKSTFVTPLTGEVHSLPAPFVMTRAWKNYAPGDTLWMLTSGGEGWWKLHTKNGIVSEDLDIDATGPFPKCGGEPQCFGMMLREYRSTWWVFAESSRGRRGWMQKTRSVDTYVVAPLPAELRDSAGIMLVGNNNSSHMPWDVDSLTLGRVNNIGLGVSSVQILPGARVLTADSASGALRLHDTTGRVLREVVLQRGGPNGLATLTALFTTPSGTSYAWDATTNSALVLDANLNVTRVIADIDFRSDSLRRAGGRLEMLGVLEDGSIVTRDRRDTVGLSAPRGERFAINTVYRRGIPGERELVNYGELPRWAAQRSADSNVWFASVEAAVVGELLLVAAPDTLAFRVHASRGNPESIVRIHKQKFRNPPGPTRDPAIAALHRIRPYERDVLSFVSAGGGVLWLETQFPGGRTLVPSWYVLDARGQVVHHARFRPGFQLKAASGNLVAGISVNGDGTRSLIVARIPGNAFSAPR